MALRRSLSWLPRLLGNQGQLAPAPALTRLPGSVTANDEQSYRSPSSHTMSLWRAYASEVQAAGSYNPAVGMTAPTESGLPPVAHVRANASHLVTYDEINHERFPVGDVNKRAFTYFVLTGARFAYASAIRLVVLKFILSMSASKDVLALASVEVGLPAIKEGSTVTIKWRGKPVFVKHRTDEEIARESAVPLSELRDPQTDADRATNPKWLVCLGVCTHLGCVPVANAGDYHGWFCPCHGSHYDASGRIRRGPAPYNLEIPEYKFLDDDTLLIG